jgi:hypothetical protein
MASDVDDSAAGQNDPAEHDEAEHDRYCGDVPGDGPEELSYGSAIIVHGDSLPVEAVSVDQWMGRPASGSSASDAVQFHAAFQRSPRIAARGHPEARVRRRAARGLALAR